MKIKLLLSLSAVAVLTGCETIQTPQQRQQDAARQQAASRYSEERVNRLQGQIESIEMENARLLQELQQMRNEVRSYSSQIAQLNSSMQALEAKQARETQEVINRVEGLLKKTVSSSPSAPSRGAGREHVVETGHTLSAIAQAYGTTVDAIKKANNLKSDNIYVGQKLFIPQ
jgi:LysM repeat protein